MDHFLTKIEGHITTDLVSLPMEQILVFFGHHPVGIVKFQIGDPSQVLLVIGGVKQMRKEALSSINSVKLNVDGKDAI